MKKGKNRKVDKVRRYNVIKTKAATYSNTVNKSMQS